MNALITWFVNWAREILDRLDVETQKQRAELELERQSDKAKIADLERQLSAAQKNNTIFAEEMKKLWQRISQYEDEDRLLRKKSEEVKSETNERLSDLRNRSDSDVLRGDL